MDGAVEHLYHELTAVPTGRKMDGAVEHVYHELTAVPTCRKMDGAVEHLYHELTAVRTGRASAALLDSLQVDAYGEKQPLLNVATVLAKGPRTLQVTVFDNDATAAVMEAVRASPLQLEPRLESGDIIVPVPGCAFSGAAHNASQKHNRGCSQQGLEPRLESGDIIVAVPGCALSGAAHNERIRVTTQQYTLHQRCLNTDSNAGAASQGLPAGSGGCGGRAPAVAMTKSFWPL